MTLCTARDSWFLHVISGTSTQWEWMLSVCATVYRQEQMCALEAVKMPAFKQYTWVRFLHWNCFHFQNTYIFGLILEKQVDLREALYVKKAVTMFASTWGVEFSVKIARRVRTPALEEVASSAASTTTHAWPSIAAADALSLQVLRFNVAFHHLLKFVYGYMSAS